MYIGVVSEVRFARLGEPDNTCSFVRARYLVLYPKGSILGLQSGHMSHSLNSLKGAIGDHLGDYSRAYEGGY